VEVNAGVKRESVDERGLPLAAGRLGEADGQ